MNVILMLWGMLSSPRALLNMGGLAIIAMVYWLGPMIGLRDPLRWIVVLSLLFLLLVLQLVLFLLGRRHKGRAAADLETSMIMEADHSIASAEASQKRAREDARRELVAAIEVLKNSGLAEGRGGKAALYVLPWYVILGAGYSGKSSLVAQSGLQSPGKGPGELRGIGASANCEWWFTNHAVLLEADRRFASAAGAKAAESDWDTYLASLGKQRPSTSLNGVVLTVSAADLMQGSAAELEEQARLLRKRLDAMGNQLKLVFPVYLMVTKMDLVEGFNDYFCGLEGAGADQILGATVHATQLRATNPEKTVAAEFELLYQNLCRRRQMRLVQDEHATRREGTFLFPLQFRSLGNSLQRFVQVLCEPNAYGRNPLLRGFYFSSAGGEGEACDQVLHEMNRVLGLPAPSASVSNAVRPLFLHGFFRKVLVPDRDIARPTRGAARRTLLMRRVAQVAALAVMAALVVNLCVAFVLSHQMISETESCVASAANAALAADRERVPNVDEQLQKLDRLRDQLVRLDRSENWPKRLLWTGLNRSRRLNDAARAVYLDRFTRIVSRPYARELEQWLLKSGRDEARFLEFYRRYQAYRMLFKPTSGDPSLVAGVLDAVLQEEAAGDHLTLGSPDRLKRHVLFAMSHADDLERAGANNLQSARQVDDFARDKISLHFNAAEYYGRIISDINQRRPDLPFSLDDVPLAHTTLAQGDAASAETSGVIPASFTRRGWDEEVSKELGNFDAMLERDAWLLPTDVMDTKTQLKNELLSLYESDYIQKWRGFLTGLVLKSPGSMDAAGKQLASLQSAELPYLVLIGRIDENLVLDGGGVQDGDVLRVLKNITDSFSVLHAYRADRKLGDDTHPQAEFLNSLKALKSLLDELGQGNKDEQNAAAFSKDLFASADAEPGVIGKHLDLVDRICLNSGFGGDPKSNEACASLLRQPGLYAWQAVLRDTERHLDGLWKETVYRDFVARLQDKYPFAVGTANEAGLTDFGNFFGAQGTLAEFVKENLQPYLDPRTFEPRLMYGSGLRTKAAASEMVRKGDQLRQVFFGQGGNTPGIKLTLTPRQSNIDKGPAGLYVTQTIFKVGDQTVSYDTGSVPPVPIVWPTDKPGASITAVMRRNGAGDHNESRLQVAKDVGSWGLFAVMAKAAQESNPSSTRSVRVWQVPLAEGTGKVIVQCELVFDRAVHAFTPGIFDFHCPPQLH